MFYDALFCYATEFEKILKYRKTTENGKHKKNPTRMCGISSSEIFWLIQIPTNLLILPHQQRKKYCSLREIAYKNLLSANA